MKINVITCLLALGTGALALSAHAEESAFHLDLHGFVSASGYVQGSPSFVLNGQGPLMLLTENSTSGQTTTGWDVRQSRLRFELTGPKVLGGATTKAVVENDFFNLNGTGGFGEISVVPRLRLAYGELNWGDTWIRFGQDWELIFNEYPQSLGHQAFPVTYWSGLSGWREVGFAVNHRFKMDDSSNVEAALQILRSDWENPYDFGSSTNQTLNVSAGQLSALPGAEARVKYNNKDSFIYAAGHISEVDGSRYAGLANQVAADSIAINKTRNWLVLEGKIGGKLVMGDFTFQGDVYLGRNTAPLIGEGLKFYSNHDVSEIGGWGQLGYNITKEWSIWGVYGQARSSLDDVNANGNGGGGATPNRYANTVYGGMIMYREGPFGFGPEVYHVDTKSAVASGGGAPDGDMQSYQAMFTGNLYF